MTGLRLGSRQSRVEQDQKSLYISLYKRETLNFPLWKRGEGGIFGKRAIHAGEADFDVAPLEAELDPVSARAIGEGDFVRRRQDLSILAFG